MASANSAAVLLQEYGVRNDKYRESINPQQIFNLQVLSFWLVQNLF